jgi:hypothetical protein
MNVHEKLDDQWLNLDWMPLALDYALCTEAARPHLSKKNTRFNFGHILAWPQQYTTKTVTANFKILFYLLAFSYAALIQKQASYLTRYGYSDMQFFKILCKRYILPI